MTACEAHYQREKVSSQVQTGGFIESPRPSFAIGLGRYKRTSIRNSNSTHDSHGSCCCGYREALPGCQVAYLGYMVRNPAQLSKVQKHPPVT